jgi:DNA-binding MarR family transcriptional regulator
MPRRVPPAAVPSVRETIRQNKPFRSVGQEAVLAVLLAADALRRGFGGLLARREGVTLQQYNVLRILRGAGPRGLPTLEIIERMVEEAPGITRLLDRLERKKWVARERSSEDRRQVICRITRPGLALLARLDPHVDGRDDEAIAMLSASEARTLIDLLNRVRAGQVSGRVAETKERNRRS